jgi:hypothetical protein
MMYLLLDNWRLLGLGPDFDLPIIVAAVHRIPVCATREATRNRIVYVDHGPFA